MDNTDNYDYEKEKRKRRRKIFFLLLWFLLTGVLLSTGTYAWFSSNRIVEIEFFDVHVETDGGIQISSDAIDWHTVLSLTDLNNAPETYPDSVNQIPVNMRPVSTGGLVDTSTGYLKMYEGNVENTGIDHYVLSTFRSIEERGAEESEASFISFDIFFRSTSPKDVYLSSESYVNYVGEEGVGIENSARVAFVKEGYRDLNGDIDVIQHLKGATDDDVYIWEPNYDTHTRSGVENAFSVFGYEINEVDEPRIKYDGVIGEIDKSEDIDVSVANSDHFPNKFKKVNPSVATTRNFNKNQYLFHIDGGITKFRVYMWLEGQDVDSENNASFGDISYFLQFTLNP